MVTNSQNFTVAKILANIEPAYYSQILDAMVAFNSENVECNSDREVEHNNDNAHGYEDVVLLPDSFENGVFLRSFEVCF